MNITIVGTGYVGLTLGAGLANLGNMVTCLDIDEKKIEKLKQGAIPFYEPGLKNLVERNVRGQRLSFTTNKQEAIQSGEVIFIAVGTPSKKDQDGKFTEEPDLKYIEAAAKDIATYMKGYKLIVTKSTVPVGTAGKIKQIITETQQINATGTQHQFDVASNPEFLREGAAIKDFENPDRVIIGVDSEEAKKRLEKIYLPLQRTGRPIIFTDIRSAELIKYAANAMLATRISFMNELSRLCEKSGADIKQVARGIGLDNRIGPRFLQAGAGYGGSCFPKDVRACIAMARQLGVDVPLLRAVDEVNEQQKRTIVPKIKELVGDGGLAGKTITLWGLSFKPKTDDIREASALIVMEQLLAEGANLRVFDPEAMKNVQQWLAEHAPTVVKEKKDNVVFAQNVYEAAQDTDALVLMTEWDEFRQVDFAKLAKLVNSKNIIDGRNIYVQETLQQHGFAYKGIGRGNYDRKA